MLIRHTETGLLFSKPANVNNLEYITIQSEGNGVDFGDLQAEGQYRSCLLYTSPSPRD